MLEVLVRDKDLQGVYDYLKSNSVLHITSRDVAVCDIPTFSRLKIQDIPYIIDKSLLCLLGIASMQMQVTDGLYDIPTDIMEYFAEDAETPVLQIVMNTYTISQAILIAMGLSCDLDDDDYGVVDDLDIDGDTYAQDSIIQATCIRDDERSLLMSFSYIDDVDCNLLQLIWTMIMKNENYFKKVWGDDFEEAKSRTLHHCMTHFDPTKGDLESYVISTGKHILRNIDTNLTHFEDIEGVITSGGQIVVEQSDDDGEYKGKSSGTIERSTEDLALSAYNMDIEMPEELPPFVLNNIKDFLRFASFLDSGTLSGARRDFSKEFVAQCVSFENRAKLFEMSLAIYETYGTVLREFLERNNNTDMKWRKSAPEFIQKKMMENVYLYAEDCDLPVEDADIENFYVANLPKGYKVLRIEYFTAWDNLCLYASKYKNSKLRVSVGDYSIQRTPGGVISEVVKDNKLDTYYDLLLEEVITNILDMFKGHLIHIGTGYVYLLTHKLTKYETQRRNLYGLDVCFEPEIVEEV